MPLKDEKAECRHCGWQGKSSQVRSDARAPLAEICPECLMDDVQVVDEYTEY